MEFTIPVIIILCVLFFFIGLLYSSVGHGGASGYIAILSFLIIAPLMISTTALILNLLVASTAFIFFYRAKHFEFALTWPFLITSVPMAFIGGMIRISAEIYMIILGAVLLFAAFRLNLDIKISRQKKTTKFPAIPIALLIGAGIGLLSGIVGVGGGIFLSPLILLMGWADTKQTSATSAGFILINSSAGLLGRFLYGNFELGTGFLIPFIIAAFCGGLVGSHLGANLLSGPTLRRILAIVLLIAAFKLFLYNFNTSEHRWLRIAL